MTRSSIIYMYCLLLLSLASSLSHTDDDRREGLTYARLSGQMKNTSDVNYSSAYTEIIKNFVYTHPANSRKEAKDVTLTLSGTIIVESQVNLEFQLTSQPAGAVLLLDKTLIIGNTQLPLNSCDGQSDTKKSTAQTLYPNKYHHLMIIHNPGCTSQTRLVSLKYRHQGTEPWQTLNASQIFTFQSTNCREGFYSQLCDKQCTDSQCSHNGRCVDGVTGDGSCTCLSGYLGSNCSEICQRDKHCSSHGRCLTDGSCACDSGYKGSDCSLTVDVNIGTRAMISIFFYSFLCFAFFVSTIVQSCRLEQSNPIAHLSLFLFSACKLTAAILTKRDLETSKISTFLLLSSTALMAFTLLKAILLIQKQFKATSPHFSNKLLNMSAFIIPLLIVGVTSLNFFSLPSVYLVITFSAISIFIFIFSVYSLYIQSSQLFTKMAELFPNLSLALNSSRKYTTVAAFFFLSQSLVTFYSIYPSEFPLTVNVSNDFLQYLMIGIDVLIMVCLGLAHDVILSDLFNVEGDDIGFVPMTATVLDDEMESELSGNTMFAPFYSTSPSVYKTAEKKYKRAGKCKRCGKCFVVYLVFQILIGVGITIYINPGYPTWNLNGMQFDGVDILNLRMKVTPNVSIQNDMRMWINVTNAKLDLLFRNHSIGSALISNQVIKARSRGLLYPEVTIEISKATGVAIGLIGEILSPDGIMEVVARGEATVMPLNLVKMHAVAECPQSVRVFPEMQIVRGCGECVYTITGLSLM